MITQKYLLPLNLYLDKRVVEDSAQAPNELLDLIPFFTE